MGLIKRKEIVGQLSGNEYEVFLPEEINLQSVQSVQLAQSVQSAQKPVVLVVPETELTVPTPNPISTDALATPKTSLKTNKKTDDEAFATMIEVFRKMGKGKSENWSELAELLKMEFDIAAARTKSVLDAAAFLTEHLRRRLLGKSTIPKTKVSKSLQDGKSSDTIDKDVEEYQAEPLSKEGRETVLKTMREYLDKGQNEFIRSFQDTYTKEDWNWLMKELEKE